MLFLSARMLNGVTDVNTFSYTDSVAMSEGDSGSVYFVLLDASKDVREQGYNPSGRRYVPAPDSMLVVTFENPREERVITRPATQAFPTADGSIWEVQLLPSDTLRGTIRMSLTLTEGSKVTRGVVDAALSVRGLDGMTRC